MTTFLSSLTLIEDVNQKIGQHEEKNAYWKSVGVRVLRNKLPYGDYIVAPKVVVDTKKDVCELASNLKSDHRRFKDSAIEAMNSGTHMVILVENTDGIRSLGDLESWEEPIAHFRKRQKMNSKAERWLGSDNRTAKDGHVYDVGLSSICGKMSERYGMEFIFCRPEDSGRVVLECLGVVV